MKINKGQLVEYASNAGHNVHKYASRVKTNFTDYILNKEFIYLVFAVYLGTVVQQLFSSITNSFEPIILKLFPKDASFKIFKIQIKYGEIIKNFITTVAAFFITFIFMYLLVRREKTYYNY